jgi:hypothetical protein
MQFVASHVSRSQAPAWDRIVLEAPPLRVQRAGAWLAACSPPEGGERLGPLTG